MTINFPLIDASLNLFSALWLLAGYVSIRKQKVIWHRNFMLAAFTTSILFLCFYLTYHFQAGSKRFTEHGWIRLVYFTLLLSHTLLATAIVPMILRTLFLAYKQNFILHARWARWTWPLWMYVSVTGVVIYWMLYH